MTVDRKFVNYNLVEPDWFTLGSTNLSDNAQSKNEQFWLTADQIQTGAPYHNKKMIAPCNNPKIRTQMTCTIPRVYNGNYFTTSEYHAPLNTNHPQNRFRYIHNQSTFANHNNSTTTTTTSTTEHFKNVDEIQMPLVRKAIHKAERETWGSAPFYKNVYQNNRSCHHKCNVLYPVDRSRRYIAPKTVQNKVCHDMCCQGGPHLHKMVTTGWYELNPVPKYELNENHNRFF